LLYDKEKRFSFIKDQWCKQRPKTTDDRRKIKDEERHGFRLWSFVYRHPFRSVMKTQYIMQYWLVLALLLLSPAMLTNAGIVRPQAINGLVLDEGETALISSTELDVNADEDPNRVQYTLTKLPTNGTLVLSGTVPISLSLGAGFSQSDINTGKVSYRHNGTEAPNDSFGFVADPGLSTKLISVNSSGTQGRNDSRIPVLSGNGRFVIFQSDADNLIADDPNNRRDIFVRDRDADADGVFDEQGAMTTAIISVNSSNFPANNESTDAAVSGDGRFVVYQSTASNLVGVGGDTNGKRDVFLRDRDLDGDGIFDEAGAVRTVRISEASDGTQGNDDSQDPAISFDGRYVSFRSRATNLVVGDANAKFDIFVRDRDADSDGVYDEAGAVTTVIVSVNDLGNEGDGDSSDNEISANGRYVTYDSLATNLVADDTNGVGDVFVHDRDADSNGVYDEAGTIRTVRVSLRFDGSQGALEEPGNYGADNPVISGNGRFVAFDADLTLGENEQPGFQDSYVHDRDTDNDGIFDEPEARRTILVSVRTDGRQSTSDSIEPKMSTDGRYVLVRSDGGSLVPNDTNNKFDTFLLDRDADGDGVFDEADGIRTVRVSVGSDSREGNDGSDVCAISPDGSTIAFDSKATNFSSDGNGTKYDIFVHTRGVAFAGELPISITPINDAPDITSIGNQTMIVNQNDLISIAFTVEDAETRPLELVVSKRTSNPGVISDGGLIIDGFPPNYVLTLRPQRDAIGAAQVTLTVSDGDIRISKSFTFEVVEEPNTAPPPWLVMLYLAGDDIEPSAEGQIGLSGAIDDLLSRLNTMPPNANMRLVIFKDGSATGDTAIFVRNPGSTRLTQVTPTPAEFIGWPGGAAPELDSGAVSTLRNFITWARDTYPGSPQSMLSVVGHGGGWSPDFLSTAQPRGRAIVQAGGGRGLAIDLSAGGGAGSSLSTRNTAEVFAGLGRFDLLFFDACLMGMVESLYEVYPYADYLVAGENLLWSQFPYEEYFAPGALTATTTGRELAAHIVASYNAPVRPDEPFVIAAFDSDELPVLTERVDDLAEALLTILNGPTQGASAAATKLRAAYGAAQKFDYDSSLSIEASDGYVDLADFAQKLTLPDFAINAEISALAQLVYEGVVGGTGTRGALIGPANKQSGAILEGAVQWDFTNAYGMAIYMPLGERDCRATGGPAVPGGPRAVAPCSTTTGSDGQPVVEPQLQTYYSKADQLRFTNEAPNWSALLLKLDAGTPAGGPEGLFTSPYPIRSIGRGIILPRSFLPMVIQ
jgi:hypothetical protein